jgi:predicted ester cyclase
MSIEENKKVMQRIYDEFLNAGNLDAADALMAADIIEHEESHRAAPGLAGTKHIIATFRSAFPDLHFRVEDMIAEGDQVVTRKRQFGHDAAARCGAYAGAGRGVTAVAHAYRQQGNRPTIKQGLIETDSTTVLLTFLGV